MTNPDSAGGLPTERGWYWHRQGGWCEPRFVDTRPGHSYLAVESINEHTGKREFTAVSRMGGTWAGRIPEPDELCRAAPAGGMERPSGRCLWFPVNVLGGPMREYAPDKWESATWPSDSAPAGSGEVEELVQFVHAEISVANGYTIGRLRTALLRKLQQGASPIAGVTHGTDEGFGDAAR